MVRQPETQESVGLWSDSAFPAKNGPELGVRSQAPKHLKESVELALACGATPAEIHAATFFPTREIGRNSQEWHERRPEPEAVPGELADCRIVSLVLAYRAGIDLDHETDLKMTANRARAWNASPDGSAQHVEKPSHEVPMIEV